MIMRMKQADGSFRMHEGGEIDIRGSYCAIQVGYMLNILTPQLTDKVKRYSLGS
jgi:protein farnesyltransferase subunit beta